MLLLEWTGLGLLTKAGYTKARIVNFYAGLTINC